MVKLIVAALIIILAGLGFYFLIYPQMKPSQTTPQNQFNEVNTQANKVTSVNTTAEDDFTALEKELSELDNTTSDLDQAINSL